jgi:hypothetical protein
MKTEKQQIIDLIDRMPDEVSAETILTELQFRLTILRRGAEAERGRTSSAMTKQSGGWVDG